MLTFNKKNIDMFVHIQEFISYTILIL